MDRSAIERALADCQPFDDPRIDLEQYSTPADIAAHVVHLAALQGDLERPVVDLGSGTGLLALGTVLAGAHEVIGIEYDEAALEIAKGNARRLDFTGAVSWILGDVRYASLCPRRLVTVVANPPFGAVEGQTGADRAFLETASEIAAVSYTFHNAGSTEFVSSFAADNGGRVTRRYRAEFDVHQQFPWHERDVDSVPVDVFRIDWRPEPAPIA